MHSGPLAAPAPVLSSTAAAAVTTSASAAASDAPVAKFVKRGPMVRPKNLRKRAKSSSEDDDVSAIPQRLLGQKLVLF